MSENPNVDDLAAKIEVLEKRVQRLTDELELFHLTASYGPGVDGVAAQAVADIYTEDGVYDVDFGTFVGHERIRGLIENSVRQEMLTKGAGHVISLPRITVNGDKAVATCHTRLYIREDKGYSVFRVVANRWEFVRTDKGWRVKRRTNRLLDGSQESRDLLKQTFDDKNEPLGG